MRVTRKGQVTIPQEIREKAGLVPGTEVAFAIDGDGRVTLSAGRAAGADAVRRALGAMRGRATSGWTTEEIMALTRE